MGLTIRYYGHSAFRLESEGKRVLVDPFITGSALCSGLLPNDLAIHHRSGDSWFLPVCGPACHLGLGTRSQPEGAGREHGQFLFRFTVVAKFALPAHLRIYRRPMGHSHRVLLPRRHSPLSEPCRSCYKRTATRSAGSG